MAEPSYLREVLTLRWGRPNTKRDHGRSPQEDCTGHSEMACDPCPLGRIRRTTSKSSADIPTSFLKATGMPRAPALQGFAMGLLTQRKGEHHGLYNSRYVGRLG